MLAFEIESDGKKCVTAGIENWTTLSLHLIALRNDKGSSSDVKRMHSLVQGLAPSDKEDNFHAFRWPKLPLEMGSILTLKIIDTVSVDEPIKVFGCDEEVQEDSFTEDVEREIRYKSFLRLKKEFEPDNE